MNKQIASALHVDFCFQFLLLPPAEVGVKDNEGNTPLHLAILHEKLKAIKALCRNQADSAALNFDNFAPVHFACWHNRVSSLEVSR